MFDVQDVIGFFPEQGLFCISYCRVVSTYIRANLFGLALTLWGFGSESHILGFVYKWMKIYLLYLVAMFISKIVFYSTGRYVYQLQGENMVGSQDRGGIGNSLNNHSAKVRRNWLSIISQLLEVIKNVVVICFVVLIFSNVDLLNSYLFSERIKLVESLPSVSMQCSYNKLYFDTHVVGTLKVSRTILWLHGENAKASLEVVNGKSISKPDLIDVLKKIGGLKGVGKEQIKVFVEFATNLGRIKGEFNPYVLEYEVNSRGEYESPVFYRDGVFDTVGF